MFIVFVNKTSQNSIYPQIICNYLDQHINHFFLSHFCIFFHDLNSLLSHCNLFNHHCELLRNNLSCKLKIPEREYYWNILYSQNKLKISSFLSTEQKKMVEAQILPVLLEQSIEKTAKLRKQEKVVQAKYSDHNWHVSFC